MLKLKVFHWTGRQNDVEAKFEQWLAEMTMKNSVTVHTMQVTGSGGTGLPDWILVVCYTARPQSLGGGLDRGTVSFDGRP